MENKKLWTDFKKVSLKHAFRFIFCELLEILPCLEQIGTCIHCGCESTVTRLVMRPLQATGENPLQSENGYKHIGFDDEPCRIHLSLICLREQKPDSFLTGGAILRISELICSLDFDHKWRTKVDRTANGSEYGLLKERKSKEVKAKQKVMWKDKLRLCWVRSSEALLPLGLPLAPQSCLYSPR